MNLSDVFKERIYNVSNFLSFGRMFLLIPFYSINAAYVADPTLERWLTLLGIIFVAVVTDFMDGYLARRWNQQTKLGRYLDPVSDKAVTVGSLFALVRFYDFPIWIFAIYIAREIAAVWGGTFLFFKRNMQGSPNWWGKTGVGLVALCVLWYVSLPLLELRFPNGHLLVQPELAAYAFLVVVIGSVFAYGRRYWDVAFGEGARQARNERD